MRPSGEESSVTGLCRCSGLGGTAEESGQKEGRDGGLGLGAQSQRTPLTLCSSTDECDKQVMQLSTEELSILTCLTDHV